MVQPEVRKVHEQAGQVLKALREERGLSQEELAGQIGCGVKSVRRWEQGKGIPHPENRRNLAEALGLTIKELMNLIHTGQLEQSQKSSEIESGDVQSEPVGEKNDEFLLKGLPQPTVNDGEAGRQNHAYIFWYQAQLPHVHEFYGRMREREILKENIRKGISTSIIGQRRIGKTWLLSYIQKRNATSPGEEIRVGYLDATQPSCATRRDFLNGVLEELEPDAEGSPLPDYPERGLINLEKCVRRLRKTNTLPLLCIDEFEGFCQRPQEFPSDFFTQLRAIAQRGLVLITVSREPLIDIVSKSGQTSPFFNIFHVMELQGFTREEASVFLAEKSVEAGFSHEEQNHMLQVVQDERGHWPPARLQLAGQQLLGDKKYGTHHPVPVNYWSEFKERLERAYRTTGF